MGQPASFAHHRYSTLRSSPPQNPLQSSANSNKHNNNHNHQDHHDHHHYHHHLHHRHQQNQPHHHFHQYHPPPNHNGHAKVDTSSSPTKGFSSVAVAGHQSYFQSGDNNGYNIRFAVNGLSKFTKGGSTLPLNHNIQVGDFGDDAGMIAENSRCIVIGLADGAGGNRNIGIDPQKFSRSLLGYCVEIIKSETIMPTQMAKLACKSIHILESQQIDGSGTLCLLALDKQTNMIHALNIGDSGFRHIRQGRIIEKSNATMAGSSPKQLYVSDSSNYKGISFINEGDILQDSDQKKFQVRPGDLIILSSDGLYDVVEDHTIERICRNRDENDLQGIADDLLLQAMKSYIHTQRDDILVMVCRIEAKN